MTLVADPFPLTVSYGFEQTAAGTWMTIRNSGDPKGFFRLAGPFLEAAIRRNVRRDLVTLKSVLETADPLRHGDVLSKSP